MISLKDVFLVIFFVAAAIVGTILYSVLTYADTALTPTQIAKISSDRNSTCRRDKLVAYLADPQNKAVTNRQAANFKLECDAIDVKIAQLKALPLAAQ